MEQKHQEQLEEQHRFEQEEEEEEEQLLQDQEEELRLETQRMVEKGHQEKVNCPSSENQSFTVGMWFH